MNLKDKVTIVTFTHYWTHAPSTELIEETFDSLYGKLPLKGCRHIINYDMPEVNEKYMEYYDNLWKLRDKYNPNIEINTETVKYKRRSYIYSDIVDTIKTPYVLFWEHDFLLLREIDIENIIQSMDEDESINCIRFNKRKTEPTKPRKNPKGIPIDSWLEQDNRININLVKTCGYSGAPHIERVEWFKTFCKKLIYSLQVKKKTSIERAINIWLTLQRKRRGEDWVHSKTGIYLYGKMGDNAYIKEITEFKSKQAWGDKAPNEEWKKINEMGK